MKIATWNVNSLAVRLPQVLDWLRLNDPDVLALQETKMEDHRFPVSEFDRMGFRPVFSGQKTYNGVALITRLPVTDCLHEMPTLDDPQRRVLAASLGDLRIINLYVPNGSEVGSAKYQYKLRWLEALAVWLEQEVRNHEKLVVMGDFNIAPEELDVHDPDLWRDKVLCSLPEREAFFKLVDLGLRDVFRIFEPTQKAFSWWDYRMNGFRRNLGLRIDHILATGSLCDHLGACQIDHDQRAHERPSDHAPVWAVFDS